MKNKIILVTAVISICLNNMVFADYETDEADIDNVLIAEDIESISVMSEETDSRAELTNLINRLNRCNPEILAEDNSYQVYAEALSEAVTVAENTDAGEEEINNAITNLNNAVKNLKYNVARYLLTNNNLTQSDMESWYGESIDAVGEGASYRYDENTPGAVISGDSENIKMNDGNLNEMIVSDSSNETVIVYDLGEEYYINGADVFSELKYMNVALLRAGIGGVKVEAGLDGQEYSEVGYQKAQTETEKGNIISVKTSADFPAVLARYVRLTIEGYSGYRKYSISESVIRGFKNPYSKDVLYDTLIKCKNADSFSTEKSYKEWQKAYREAERVYWDLSADANTIINAKENLINAYNNLEKVGLGTYIISGNVNAADSGKYTEGQKTLSGITYTYTSDSNSEAKINDPDCNKLLKGDTSAMTGEDIVFGAYDDRDGSPVKVLFDMGSECYISGVDVWSIIQSNNNTNYDVYTEYVTVSIPDSSGEYYEISSQRMQELPEAITQTMVSNKQMFEPVKTRYLLITCDKGTSHQNVLGEIIIFGDWKKEEASDKYAIESTDYKNALGKRIQSIDSQEEITASGTVASNSSTDEDIVVVTVAYKDNDIVDYSFTEMTLGAFKTNQFSNKLNLKGETGVDLYSFVWQGLDKMVLISKTKPFGSI